MYQKLWVFAAFLLPVTQGDFVSEAASHSRSQIISLGANAETLIQPLQMTSLQNTWISQSDQNLAPVSADGLVDTPPPNYQCIQHSGRFLTIAQTPRGQVPLIVWQSRAFGSQWTPEARCKAVSTRFQAFAAQNLLQYVSTGELNSYPIICVSGEYGECINNGLLLTLEPQDNPTLVLKELFNLSDAITRSPTKPVIDLEYILEEKKTLETDMAEDNGALIQPSP